MVQPLKLKSREFRTAIRELEPDLAVVVAFRMLPKVVWSIPKMGTINLHAALLPDYRGAAPLNWVLINGETETGLTTFFIDEKIDTGAILKQVRFDLPGDWTAGDLHDHAMEVGAQLVLETVNDLEAGQLTAKVQDGTQFEHPAPKIFKEDCQIDWQQPAEKIHNFIRGLSPYPTAWTRLGEQTMKIFRTQPAATPESHPDLSPGSLIQEGKTSLLVATGEGYLEILELQLQGKRRMAVKDFLLGYRGELDTFN